MGTIILDTRNTKGIHSFYVAMEKHFVAKFVISISEASHAISTESYLKKKKKKAALQKGWIGKLWQNQLAASMTAARQGWEVTHKYQWSGWATKHIHFLERLCRCEM